MQPNGLTFNRQGSALYGVEASGAVNELVWATRFGGVTPVDPDWSGIFNYPELSPDGRRLAVSYTIAGEEQIWIKQLDRGPEEKLTSEGSGSFRPTWSPDGREITYVVGGDDLSRDLYSRRADGSAGAEVLMDLPVLGLWEAEYSSDGRWLLHRTDRDAYCDLFALSLETGDTLTLLASEYDERQLALSPDTRWLAYISNRSGRYEVYVRPFPNTGDDFTTGAVTELFPDRGYMAALNRRQYDVAPDGRFLMIRNVDGGSLDLVYVENWFKELKERLGG